MDPSWDNAKSSCQLLLFLTIVNHFSGKNSQGNTPRSQLEQEFSLWISINKGKRTDLINQRISPGTPIVGPFPISHRLPTPFQYFKGFYGSGFRGGWQWGSHYWGSLEFPLHHDSSLLDLCPTARIVRPSVCFLYTFREENHWLASNYIMI